MSTLNVDKVDPSSGTALELGTSGDTINVPSGVTLDINSGATLDATGATITGALTNTPAFFATASSAQNLTDLVATKVQFDSEIFDSGSVYDASTNYRFTPAVVGKYYIYSTLTIAGSADAIESMQLMIYKNGSNIINSLNIFGTHDHSEMSQFVYGVDIANTTDYYEIYGNVNVSSGNAALSGTSSKRNIFGAYLLIGA